MKYSKNKDKMRKCIKCLFICLGILLCDLNQVVIAQETPDSIGQKIKIPSRYDLIHTDLIVFTKGNEIQLPHSPFRTSSWALLSERYIMEDNEVILIVQAGILDIPRVDSSFVDFNQKEKEFYVKSHISSNKWGGWYGYAFDTICVGNLAAGHYSVIYDMSYTDYRFRDSGILQDIDTLQFQVYPSEAKALEIESEENEKIRLAIGKSEIVRNMTISQKEEGKIIVSYVLPEPQKVSIVLTGPSRQKMSDLLEGIEQTEGRHELEIDMSSFQKGIYILKVRIGEDLYNKGFVY